MCIFSVQGNQIYLSDGINKLNNRKSNKQTMKQKKKSKKKVPN